jgi:hypothetical protein
MQTFKKGFDLTRMALGSLLGIVGFGTISLAILPFRGEQLGMGLGELALGTVLALGVLTPLRTARHHVS